MKDKIKILYGLEAASGGALKHLVYLATNLDYHQFDITIMLSPRDSESWEAIDTLKTFGINVIIVKMSRNVNFFKDFVNLCYITFYLLKNSFDVIHAHSSKAGFYFRLAGCLTGVKVILYTPHCFYFQSKKGLKRWIFKSIERLLGIISHRIIVSKNEYDECITSKIVPDRKLININNAINFSEYVEHNKDVVRSCLNLPVDSMIIGTIGRLVEQKDVLTLIRVAALLIPKYPKVYFIIAGTGELKDALNREILDYGLEERVFLLGHYSEIGIVYSAIDIFVSTSLWEGLPYVILEAMWYSKPIVATNMAYDYILDDDQMDYIISPGDLPLLYEKLSLLIEDRQLCENIGQRNRANVKANFSFKEFVRSHKILYSQPKNF